LFFNFRYRIWLFLLCYDVQTKKLIAGGLPYTGSYDFHLDPSNHYYFQKNIVEHIWDDIPIFQVGTIDIQAKHYQELTTLPEGHGVSTIAGTAYALDATSRLLAVSTVGFQDDQTGHIDMVNLVNGVVQSFPQQSTNRLQGLLFAHDKFFILYAASNSRHMTTGIFYPSNNSIVPLSQWPDNSLIFTIDGVTISDPSSNVAYSIIGSGGGPPVALVTFDDVNGQFGKGAIFPGSGENYNQPMYIFML